MSGQGTGCKVTTRRSAQYIEDAPAEEKQAAFEAAIDEGIAELDAGEGITGTPSDLMTRIDKRLGMDRNDTT